MSTTPNEAHIVLSDNLTEYCIDCGHLTTRGHSAYTNRFDFRWRCAGCQVAYIVDKRGTWSDVVTADTPPGFELRTRKTQGEIMRASGYQSPAVATTDWHKLQTKLDAARKNVAHSLNDAMAETGRQVLVIRRGLLWWAAISAGAFAALAVVLAVILW